MSRAEAFLVARAVVRVLADSTCTEEIHRVEEITGRARAISPIYYEFPREWQPAGAPSDILAHHARVGNAAREPSRTSPSSAAPDPAVPDAKKQGDAKKREEAK